MLEGLVRILTSLGLFSLLLVTGCLLWFRWSHRELLKLAAKIPVVRPTVPLLGHAYLTLRGMEGSNKSLGSLKGVNIAKRTILPREYLYIYTYTFIYTYFIFHFMANCTIFFRSVVISNVMTILD